MSGRVKKVELKDGSTKYYPYIRFEGREKGLKGCSTQRNAETALRKAANSIDEGTFGETDAPLFDELAHKWLNDVARLKVKPSTLARYTSDVDNHLCPYFGRMKLKSINVAKIDTFKSEKIDSGLSPRTVNSMLKQLGAVLKYALRLDYISRNPMDHVDNVKVVVDEMDFLTAPEVQRLLDAVPTEHHALFATAVLTGAREGELLAVKWGDFDAKMNALYIRRTYSPAWGETAPKSTAGRRAVQLTPELVDILKAHRENSPYDGSDDLIFPNQVGTWMDYHNLTNRVLKETLDKAGLRQIRFHDLRHTYAALCISQGVNFKWLQRQMGHASITTTMDTYGHIMPEVEERLGGKLDSLLFDEKVVPFEKKASSK